ncbi:Abi family protein [Bacteroides sp. 224]|uniref:Abi family protein n=1 Tax=Bacteroides sp. 224 TaxID=2302936 RepID=UPI0013D4AE29|nr:Abi family protein [Bacteroides sp. 224]NDV66914.1 Abi family protein [Bacteroides sp. 224]
MKYIKQPLSIQLQIDKLKSRGLIFDDEKIAVDYLSNISYYRLRAYTYPFQDNTDEDNDHHFIRNDIHFKDIIDLYCFDRRLRSLIFNAIEKIEVAIRTKIVYEYAIATQDSHWFMNEDLYRDNYENIIEDMGGEVDRSNEDFIKHYDQKYNDPDFPPAWMTLEVLSFGTLSRMFSFLDSKSDPNKKIAKEFGLPNSFILENWMHSLSVLRNCCAHHSRIWNRRFPVGLKLPYNTSYPFIGRETIKTIHNNKLFASLSCIKYILDIISPQSDFKKNLISIIQDGGNLLKIKDMGFPENWAYLDVWKEK